MAVKVLIKRGGVGVGDVVDKHADGGSFWVTEGHLHVSSETDEKLGSVIAIYSPGTWAHAEITK